MNNSDTTQPVETIAIIGLGLLGASLGMAMRDKGFRRLGWTRRDEVRNWAVRKDVVDETAACVEDILAAADLTVLCLPIPKIAEFIRKYAPYWKKGAIVTDIGSVKEIITTCGEENLTPRGVRFVGSHPMAGTEKSGPQAAFPALYKNAEVFVTPSPATDKDALRQVVGMWEAIGTRTVLVEPREHDMLVAHTSHISHILALALTESVLDCSPEDRKLRYSGCATGFRDTSRISSSSPLMWREIIENNQPAVLEVVNEFERRWKNLREIIESKEYDRLQEEFAKGKKLRDDWILYKNTEHNSNW